MKTATSSELRTKTNLVLGWAEAGEEVTITKRGKKIATLVPEKYKVPESKPVDWSKSAALTMDRSKMRKLTAKEVLSLIHDSQGRY